MFIYIGALISEKPNGKITLLTETIITLNIEFICFLLNINYILSNSSLQPLHTLFSLNSSYKSPEALGFYFINI